MKLIRKLYGMFLVCLGDLAAAAIIAPVLIIIMDYHLSAAIINPILMIVPVLTLLLNYHIIEIGLIVIAGMIVSVSPDLDIPLSKLFISNKPEDISKHRDILHKPLAIIPIFIGLHFFSVFWAYLVSLCLLAHFIHDSTGSGYGIKWFQPFSKNSYKFCAKHIICMYTPEYIAAHPWNPILDWWLEEYYLKSSPERNAGIILALIAPIPLAIVIIW